jgi:hypothetical protein
MILLSSLIAETSRCPTMTIHCCLNTLATSLGLDPEISVHDLAKKVQVMITNAE